MQFASPYFLWLLAVIPLMVVYYVWRTRQGGASIQVSTIDGVAEAPRTVRYYLRHLPFALRCAAVALLIVALARPQSVDEGSTSNTEGIDIVLAIDISTSMLAQDLQPDRIQAAKQVAGNFIADRPGDRIGLVAFAGEAFTQSPLTTDQGTLQTLLGRLRSGVVEDGTAIGNGLATAINRLRESDATSMPMERSACATWLPQAPLVCVPSMKRISMPKARPAAKETSTPESEFHDSTTNSTATV